MLTRRTLLNATAAGSAAAALPRFGRAQTRPVIKIGVLNDMSGPYADDTGPGVVLAARKPIYGAEKIARFIVGVQRKADFPIDAIFTPVSVNGDPGVRMDSASDGFLSIVAVEVADGAVQSVRFFTNPERFPVAPPH